MVVWILRFILLGLIVFLFYRAVKYLVQPTRKLESARKHHQFFMSDHDDVRKNIVLTYKGAVFAGEKYMGPTDETFDVVSISLWPENTASLKGMVREDFCFIDRKIKEHYPNAEINWRSPVKEFLYEK
ncbi:sigma-w pathway protein ysdB [Bacillus sp. FJAT-29814]|uniref:sigma-w pathway protein ysdB n=1 Tax=Bacillus sp. FJAT-29814 TaxID=1729688 RepID=UPI00082A1649|nr:sigma-w pathway protein ysdB [Bacillus sp. FJAT-29814]